MADLHTKPKAQVAATGNLLRPGTAEAETGLLAEAARGGGVGGDLERKALYRRAVEAAIWGLPLVKFDALREAYFSDAGARLHDVIFWSEPPSWRFQAPTPDVSTRPVLFFLDLADGPMVVEIPPAGKAELSGTLIDSWNVPIVDVGPNGADKGKGAKYLVLPPEHETRHAMGFLPVKSTTHNLYGLLRLDPKSDGDEDLDEMVAYLKHVRIYPLSGGGPTRRQRFIDMAHRKFEGAIAWDSGFFAVLARMVAAEPVKTRDEAMMGLLHTIGIGRTLNFQPSDATEAIFASAIADAHAFVSAGRRKTGSAPWPDRRWRSRAILGSTFAIDGRLLVDDRAFACLGSSAVRHGTTAERQFESFVDERDAPLDGSRAYRLVISGELQDVVWSVAAYDPETNAFIREATNVGFHSKDPGLERNDDGSVELHFAPDPPRNRDTNWISTADGRPFFILLRVEEPEESASWSIGDVEPLA